MCLITPTIGLGLAQTGLNFFAQTAQANAQNQYAMMNAKAANDAAILKYGQELNRQREEAANATRQRQQAWREGIEAQGTALASSQNEGNSLNMTLGDLARQSLRQINLIDADQKIDQQQGKDNLYAIQKEAESRIAGVETVAPPSLLNLAVSGYGAFVNGKNDLKIPKTKSRGYPVNYGDYRANHYAGEMVGR